MAGVETKPVIWIIDNQHWPRAYLRAELIERGFEAIGFISIAHALAAYRYPYIEKPHFIVLELFELTLKRNELETLVHTGVPIIFLGGTIELNERLIREYTWAAVIRRPFTIVTVVDVVEKLLRGKTSKEK